MKLFVRREKKKRNVCVWMCVCACVGDATKTIFQKKTKQMNSAKCFVIRAFF